MSDTMLNAIIRMPYDMAMASELSRLQFYDRAQSLLDARAADKARIAELTEALVRCRHQASYMIGGGEALSNQLNKVREIANAALAQQGKEGRL